MKFIAAITHRSAGDYDGKGWSLPTEAKEFPPNTPIIEIWEWYEQDTSRGLLEIIKLQE